MQAIGIVADVPPGKPGCAVQAGAGAWLALVLVGAAWLRRRRS